MKLSHLPLVVLTLSIVLGCGGGGGSSAGGSFGALFMTDSLDSHDHVWVTVKKAVLTSAGGNVTVNAGFTTRLGPVRYHAYQHGALHRPA